MARPLTDNDAYWALLRRRRRRPSLLVTFARILLGALVLACLLPLVGCAHDTTIVSTRARA